MTNTKSLHTLASETAHRLGMGLGTDMGPIVDAVDEAYAMGKHAAAEHPVTYPHFSDVLTDEVIDGIAKRAIASGDIVLAMRCDHAKTDGLAMRDLAITLEEQWANRTLTEEDRAGLDPGIAWLVTALHSVGFRTCDSGDGSNWEKGMTCALPYRHVVIMCAPWQDAKAETERVARYLAWIGADDEFEAVLTEVVDTNDHSPGVIFVADKRREEIMAEVGYVAPTFEELTCGEDEAAP